MGGVTSTKTCNRPICETVQDSTKDSKLLWRTNRKSHTHFRLVPKSMTLDDLERPKRHSCRNTKSFTEPTRKKWNEDRPICYQRQNV